MPAKYRNQETFIGRIYQTDLKLKKVENKSSKHFGKDFISGTVDVATDEEGLNVVTVHYTFVPSDRGQTYDNLKSIMDGGKSWITVGKENAERVRLTPNIAVNDFVSSQSGEMISSVRNEGGYVNFFRYDFPEEDNRNHFEEDMVITSFVRNDEAETPYADIRGVVFDFRNGLIPITFKIYDQAGMNYFESLDVSSQNPCYTRIWGKVVNTTIKTTRTEESAFGEGRVITTNKNVREYVITGCNPTPNELTEDVLKDVKEGMQNREIHLAEVRKRDEEYRASRNTNVSSGTAASVNVIPGGFNF